MNFYTILLFVHVTGAIGILVGMASWLIGITAIARVSRVEQVRTLTEILLMTRYIVPVSAFFTIASGLTMALSAWGLQTGWMLVAIGSLFVIGPTGTWLVDPKVQAIAALARTLPDGPLPASLASRTHDFVLRTALHTLTAMLLGIVFLMTTKPTFSSSIVAMVVSLFLGLVSSLPLVRPDHGSSEQSKKRSVRGIS
jgi:hypothetical protein